MPNRKRSPDIDDELVRLKAKLSDMGRIKLATWGTKEQMKAFLEGDPEEIRRWG